jgi:hypothetical protein
MSIIYWLVGAAVAVGLVILVISIINAPKGYEDDDGFHYDE